MTRERIVRFLNEALALDPDGVQEILSLRVITTEAMLSHPTIVTDPGGPPQLTVLGLIQGLISDPRELLLPNRDANGNTYFA